MVNSRVGVQPFDSSEAMQKKAPDTPKPVPVAVDFSAYRITDPEEFGRNMLRLLEEGSSALSSFLERSNGKTGPVSTASEITDAAKLFLEIAQSWVNDPIRLAETQGELVRNYLELAGATSQRLMGTEVPAVAEPEPGDNRFKDPEWEQNPYFDFCKQSYLITMRWLDEVLQKTDGLDERTRQLAEFYLKQLGSALSPSNFPMTNPEVLRETFATSGKNLVQGMANLVRDMERSGDVFSITQTDLDAFEVGRNVATAPGKVIFQNDLL
jgi:polyhydroxyalkanoate synthase subunit PhaC